MPATHSYRHGIHKCFDVSILFAFEPPVNNNKNKQSSASSSSIFASICFSYLNCMNLSINLCPYFNTAAYYKTFASRFLRINDNEVYSHCSMNEKCHYFNSICSWNDLYRCKQDTENNRTQHMNGGGQIQNL